MVASLGALAVHLALLIFAAHSVSIEMNYKLQLSQAKQTTLTKKNRTTEMKGQSRININQEYFSYKSNFFLLIETS